MKALVCQHAEDRDSAAESADDGRDKRIMSGAG